MKRETSGKSERERKSKGAIPMTGLVLRRSAAGLGRARPNHGSLVDRSLLPNVSYSLVALVVSKLIICNRSTQLNERDNGTASPSRSLPACSSTLTRLSRSLYRRVVHPTHLAARQSTIGEMVHDNVHSQQELVLALSLPAQLSSQLIRPLSTQTRSSRT